MVESMELCPMLKVSLALFTTFKRECKFCKKGVNMQWARLNHRVSKSVRNSARMLSNKIVLQDGERAKFRLKVLII